MIMRHYSAAAYFRAGKRKPVFRVSKTLVVSLKREFPSLGTAFF